MVSTEMRNTDFICIITITGLKLSTNIMFYKKRITNYD